MGSSNSTELPAASGRWLAEDEQAVYDPSKGPIFVTNKSEKRQILYSKKGFGSAEECPSITFSELFKQAVEKKKDKVALRWEDPCPPLHKDGSAPPSLPLEEWKSATWGEYYEECRKVAKAILSLGANRLDGSCIFGANSRFWLYSHVGSIMSSTIPTGIYPTDTIEQIGYKMAYVDTVVAFCGEKKNYDAVAANIEKCPKLKAVVVWAWEPTSPEIKRADGSVVKVLTWDQFMDCGKVKTDEDLEKCLAAQDPRECCNFVFTSGTTGKPKAAMISHDNNVFVGLAVLKNNTLLGSDVERTLSYLPLSHVAGLLVDVVLPISIGAKSEHPITIHFTRPYDLKAGSLGDRLRAVRPTSFMGVPRVWQKVAEKIRAKGAETTGLKKKIVDFAKSRGFIYESNRQRGMDGSKPFFYDRMNNMILSKVKEALGLDACRIAITGAAPMPKDILNYFGSLGISLNDGYGMTETSGAALACTTECCEWGTVGAIYPGTETRIFKVSETDLNDKTECPRANEIFSPSEEEQGEICMRGRHIMMGYYANPFLGEDFVKECELKTAESIDKDGWLHSGDKGACSKENMFVLTGRYKELIIGAGGENISPVPVESLIKELAPGISNVLMVGNDLKFNIALVTLRAVGATGELAGGDDLDPDVYNIGSAGVTKISQAIEDPKWIDHIQSAIQSYNSNGLVCQSNAWKVQKFTILPQDFSIVGGELTPTLKVKRAFVDQKYSKIIQHMMDSSDVFVKCPDAIKSEYIMQQ